MRVLVSGGSGFVGRAVVEALRAAGHAPRVLARGTRAPAAAPGRPAGETVPGSVLDPASLPSACAGCDAVIHLVGIISEIGEQTFERVHVEGTRHLLAAARAAGVRRWVQMSALGARPGAPSRYHATKWAAEELVRASDFDWTIFRPSMICGPGDGFVSFFARMAHWSPVLPVMGPGTNRLQPVAVAEVAEAFARSLEARGAVGQTIDLVGTERVAFAEALRALGGASGRQRWLLHYPWPVARALATLLETVYPVLLRRAPPLNRTQLTMLQEDNVGDGAAATALLGRPLTGYREILAGMFPR